MMEGFDKFFKQATSHEGPFDYQQKLATEGELPQLEGVEIKGYMAHTGIQPITG